MQLYASVLVNNAIRKVCFNSTSRNSSFLSSDVDIELELFLSLVNLCSDWSTSLFLNFDHDTRKCEVKAAARSCAEFFHVKYAVRNIVF